MASIENRSRFVLKSFADLQPTRFNDSLDHRCRSVARSAMDRKTDLFSTWDHQEGGRAFHT